MAFLKRMAGFYALTATVIYVAFASSLEDNVAWGLIASIILGCLVFIGSPEAKASKQVRRQQPRAEAEVVIEQEDEADAGLDIPEAVTQEPMDGATLRERKLAKIQAAEAQKTQAVAAAEAESDDEEELVEVTLEMEDVHTADEFVVEVSAESVEDADIEATVKQRNIRHDVIRERIEKRRRGQLAEIRASTAKMWEDQTAGEDLVALLQTPGHGHSVLVEPENPEPGHIYGATFVRIDEARILKLRTPLDSGFEQVKKEKVPELPVLLDPDGKPLPPLPPLGEGMPLPPLPMPPASGALAALKDEMES
ncbi:MAG: hypothetical protein QF633_07895 [Candidatus Poseidoniaceae archaeon]|jgi:hypothetical protein|nr:hypothetical protein [Candidatus Poseidoniaceae archaeon]